MVQDSEGGTPTRLTFVIDFAPQPKQRTSNTISRGRVRRFTPNETRVFEAKVAQIAWLAMREQSIAKCEGKPVNMMLHFYFGLPKSLSKKAASARLGTHHTIKPDLTNLAKSIEDGCNGVVYTDDCQISSVSMMKTWGVLPRVDVTFTW